MSGFFYGIYIQWLIDIRNKEALLFYYLVPLLFYAFVGSFFLSVMEEFADMMIISMSVFGISMGGLLGSGLPICTHYGSVLRKAYQVGNIPFWAYLVQNFISACIHLMIMVTMILISAPLIFKVSLNIPIAEFYFGMLIYAALCICISSLLGLIFQSSNKMTMGSQCIFFPSVLLSGMMMPTSMLNDTFQMISKVTPASWVLNWLQGDSMFLWVLLVAIVVIGVLIMLRLNKVKHTDLASS